MFNTWINYLWKIYVVIESFQFLDYVCDETFISLNSFSVHGSLCTENKVTLVTAVVVCSLTSIQEARGNVPIIYWSASAP